MAHNTRNSDLSQIAVNANNIPDGGWPKSPISPLRILDIEFLPPSPHQTDSVDCGIKGLGWCRGPGCQKYARLRTFILVLAISGTLQGACESYFRVSAKQASFQFGWNPLIVGE